PMYLRPDGNWVSGTIMGLNVNTATSYTHTELLFGPSGVLTDTLRNVDVVTPPLSVTIDSVRFRREQLLPDDSILAFSPGGAMLIVRRDGPVSPASSAFSVASISISGDTVFDRTFEYRPIPVDETYIDRVLE